MDKKNVRYTIIHIPAYTNILNWRIPRNDITFVDRMPEMNTDYLSHTFYTLFDKKKN